MADPKALEKAEVRKEAIAEGPIVFYDGDCGLCAKSVQFVMRHDKKGLFRFAPLQGATAARVLGLPSRPADTWTMVLLDDRGVFDRSTGALKILQLVRWGAFLPGLCLLVPRAIRDAVYRVIAKIRYRVWGHADRCPLPTKSQTSRFMP